MSFLSKLLPFDIKAERAYAKEVEKINSFKEEIANLTEEQIKTEIASFKKDLQEFSGDMLFKKLVEIRPRVFALTREAAKRAIGQFHYDVQLMGGIALTEHKIAEMKTGEGKTLTGTLPQVLFALSGKGSHLVTVNDYLSRWQASLMGPVFHYLGLSIASIQHEASFLYDPTYQPEQEEIEKIEGEVEGLVLDVKHMRPISRKEAYLADVTYGTNNEFGFDYLRDNMAQTMDRVVQRELFFANVDEVDSILIDEARTPLIISAPDTEPTDKYYQFAKLVGQLQKDTHYVVDEKRKVSTLTDDGISKIESILHIENIYDTSGGVTTLHHIEQALRARANYERDRDYVVRDNEVIIVDEFTGRLMFGRRYSEGLHQAIEAKENVKIQQESKTLATITFQNLFRLYEHLAGMTGTAKTEEEEFFKIYRLQVMPIPTNKPMVRNDRADIVYKTEAAKFSAIAKEVKERNKKGQPMLIGTVSIAKNELLAEYLKKEGVPFEILNAKNHEREAHIISQAGRFGAVTLATNIAGRGVDILLGGNPVDAEEAKAVREAGGLCVIGTERHESRRIDNQLRGRSGRQGDPGESIFFVSMEDDLMRLFGGDRMKNMMDRLGLPDDQPLEAKLVSRSIEQAQKKIEGINFDTRKSVLEFDDVLNQQRIKIYNKRRKYLNDQQAASQKQQVESEEVSNDDEEQKPATLRDEVLGLVHDEISNIVTFNFNAEEDEQKALQTVMEEASSIVPIDNTTKEQIITAGTNAANREFAVVDALYAEAQKIYQAKEKELGAVYDEVQRYIILSSIDQLWMEHLDTMDHLRDSVRLRGYGQRDPVIEYKREGFDMFQRLQKEIDKQIVHSVLKVSVQVQAQSQPVQDSGWVTNKSDTTVGGSVTPASSSDIGRNDPCPCGAINPATGQVYKYKKCGMINAPYHKK